MSDGGNGAGTVVVVDDDEAQLTFISRSLERAGMAVRSFLTARAALDHCDAEAPALVISDVVMPELGGFELRDRYLERYPERTTPFVFLSSVSDARTIARGLDSGADDFLQKPIDPVVLEAKVRAILRRRWRAPQSSFHGGLAAFPLSRLLRFCETQGLTGYVDFFDGDSLLSLRFKAGQIDDPAAESILTQIADLEDAPFVVHSVPIDFEELGARKRQARDIAPERPVGRISSVRLRDRVFLVQTELAGWDPQFIVSVVQLDGRTVWKHSERVPNDLDAAAITEGIDRKHDAIENKLNERMADQLVQRAGPAAPRRRFDELFDEGFERFRAQDFAAAIASWELALEIDPTNAALRANLKVARQRQSGGAT